MNPERCRFSCGRWRWAAVVSCWAAFSFACASSERRPDGPVVDRFEFQGVDQLDEGELRSKIVTSDSSWVPFVPREHFDATAWQADLRRIERFYQARGYYQAKVVEQEVTPTGPNSVALKVRVEEGRPTTVRGLVVDGLEDIDPKHRERALADLPLEVGEVFLEADWDALKSTVEERLKELGYATAQVQGEVRVDVATQEARVHLAVTPGLRYRFGNIFVATDARPQVSARRIIEQAQTGAAPGSWYSQSALNEAQQRVFQMGVFGAVKVSAGTPDPQAATIPVVVDVREAPFRTLRAGGGIGADANRQEGRLIGEFTHRNFFGDLRRFTTRGKLGYAFLPNVFAVLGNADNAKDGVIAQILNELEQPRLFHPNFSLQTTLELERSIEPAYEFYGGRYKLGVAWKPRSHFRIVPAYAVELYRLSSPLTQSQGLGLAAPQELIGCPETCVLSYLEQLVEYDRRDNPLEPRKGIYAGVAFQEGGGPLGGSFSYLRVLPDLRGYLSFGEDQRLTLAGRIRAGTLYTYGAGGSSPIVARFFAGGATSMRGFNSRRLSPLVAIPRTTNGVTTVETLPVGGDGLFETQLEARYNLIGDFVVALFNDWGTVTRESLSLRPELLVPQLYGAVGMGLRYRTPLGPIRLDLAARLPVGPPLTIVEGPGGDVRPSSGCFGLGATPGNYAGSPEGLCSFHLSIGEAF